MDWLTWLADHAREDELFRHDLDRWETEGEQSKKLINTATELVASRPFKSFLAAREQERPAPRHVATHGIFGKPATVVCVTDFPPVVTDHGHTVVVSAAGRDITFVAKAKPALQLLLSGSPTCVDDVVSATGIDAAPLAEMLVEEDICAEVTPELAAGYSDWVS